MAARLSYRATLLAGAALMWPLPAAAAEMDATAPAAVQEVVVTATRREERLAKVAESVSAFPAAKIEQLGAKSFADLARYTPGVSFDESTHDISIRGVVSQAGSGTTGIYIDDTPIQMRALGFNPNNTLPSVFDLARIEVLRGPQGTLFGAGSEGGTVRYITAQPSLTVSNATVRAEAAQTLGGGPSGEFGAALGGPLVEDKLGFRISAWSRRDGGYLDRVDYQTLSPTERNANRTDTVELRAAITWAPAPGLTITPSIESQTRNQHNQDLYWVSISQPKAGRFLSGTPERMGDADRFLLPSLKIEYAGGGVRFVSSTAWYDRSERVNGYSGTLYDLSYFQQLTGAGVDPQGAPCPGCATDPSPLLSATGPNLPGFGPFKAVGVIANRQRNFTQEFRLQSNDAAARFSWVAGLFYAYDTQRSTEFIRDPQLPALTQYLWQEDMLTAWGEDLLPGDLEYLNDTRAHDRQVALFAEGVYGLTDRLKLTAGLRWAWTRFDYSNLNDGPQDLLLSGGVPARASGAKEETPLTPRLSLSYQLTDDDMVYATVARGYRIGGATPPLPAAACGASFPTSYRSDAVTSWEAGAKGRAFDRTLDFAASAYVVRWSNIQQAIYVPACGLQFTGNVGEALAQGFDLQADWRIGRGFRLEATLGYTDAHFRGATVEPLSGVVLAQRGDTLETPPWSASLGAQYDFSLNDRDGFVRADYAWSSRRTRPLPSENPLNGAYDPGLTPNPAVSTLSVRAGLALGGSELNLFADNLLNAKPRLDLTHEDSFTALYEARTLRPRTIGLSATWRR